MCAPKSLININRLLKTLQIMLKIKLDRGVL
jgi:hypothetical protein